MVGHALACLLGLLSAAEEARKSVPYHWFADLPGDENRLGHALRTLGHLPFGFGLLALVSHAFRGELPTSLRGHPGSSPAGETEPSRSADLILRLFGRASTLPHAP